MPLGNITQRLGIGNAKVPDPSSFASTVLRLPSNIPIYQQQLVHSMAWEHGPASAAAEWCGQANSEIAHQKTIREISAHDTQFARRNISDSPNFSLITHRSSYTSQIYYVNNEPEAGSSLATAGSCDANCWNPRDRNIDQCSCLSGCFPNPNNQFWEFLTEGVDVDSCASQINYRRILPNALALIYLRLKNETETLGRNHIVLPPAAANAKLGSTNTYWQTFYNKVHSGVTVGNCSESSITPADLKALHIHHYSLIPSPTLTPLQSVALSATEIRTGVNWYKNLPYVIPFLSNGKLPLDILLSEMGFYWTIDGDIRWAGGWSNFRKGLSWWNSWLCWLTRRAPFECNLEGWDEENGHTLYACIHEADIYPYATTLTPTQNNRNQWFFNADTWKTHVYYNVPAITVSGLTVDQTGSQIYQNSFTAFNSINWGNSYWRTTPFGACYAVWAQIGADRLTENLNTGWVTNSQGGIAASAAVFLPAGYSTVYFSIIKSLGEFTPSTNFGIRWKSGNFSHYQGFMPSNDFEDSQCYTYNGIDQDAYSAMVYPVVCYSTIARYVTVELTRNISGLPVWLGRPIIFPGACSWFVTQ